MARKTHSQTNSLSRLKRAADAVKRLLTRGRGHDTAEVQQPAEAQRQTRTSTAPPAARVTRRETDIPMDVLGSSYTPPVTSSKASFRSDGADHHTDQEYGSGMADSRWNDEDRFTNKSGDPRIGTHRRTYEPAEDRPETRD